VRAAGGRETDANARAPENGQLRGACSSLMTSASAVWVAGRLKPHCRAWLRSVL
jgi:hypothetical protein